MRDERELRHTRDTRDVRDIKDVRDYRESTFRDKSYYHDSDEDHFKNRASFRTQHERFGASPHKDERTETRAHEVGKTDHSSYKRDWDIDKESITDSVRGRKRAHDIMTMSNIAKEEEPYTEDKGEWRGRGRDDAEKKRKKSEDSEKERKCLHPILRIVLQKFSYVLCD